MANGIELATAYVSLTVDGSQVDSGVRKSLSGVDAQADRVGKSAGKTMGKGMSAGVLGAVGKIAGPLAAVFAGVKVGQLFSSAIDEATEAQKVTAATNAIIQSTGGTAKISAAKVGDLSTALSELIGVDDEIIQGSANLLLTFKNIRNEVGRDNDIFNQALVAAQDLSAAGFGSVESASKTLGKALNDPVKGMTALGRAGVTFSEAQKKQIKSLVSSNDLLGAQKIILGEVESQVGGVAEATATSAEKAQVAWANLKEDLGTALLPALNRISDWFRETGIPAIREFATGIGGVASILFKGDFAGAAKTFGFAEDSGQVNFLFGLRDAFIAVKDAVVVAVGWIRDDLWPAIQDGWERIQPGLEQARQIIADAFGGDNKETLTGFADFFTGTLIPIISTFVNEWLPVMATQIAATIEVVKAFWGAFITLRDTVISATSVILSALSKVLNTSAQMFEVLSTVPGFGWAADAAKKLRNAADKADEVRAAIERIPRNVPITITAQVSMPGRITLPGGERVNIGLKEHGGPVRAGQPYIVGEKRPELFVPGSNGRIIPRVPEAGSGGAAGSDPARDVWLARLFASELANADLAVGVRDVERGLYKRGRVNALASPGR